MRCFSVRYRTGFFCLCRSSLLIICDDHSPKYGNFVPRRLSFPVFLPAVSCQNGAVRTMRCSARGDICVPPGTAGLSPPCGIPVDNSACVLCGLAWAPGAFVLHVAVHRGHGRICLCHSVIIAALRGGSSELEPGTSGTFPDRCRPQLPCGGPHVPQTFGSCLGG